MSSKGILYVKAGEYPTLFRFNLLHLYLIISCIENCTYKFKKGNVRKYVQRNARKRRMEVHAA